ncbi:MAG TPA: hypothetical protein VN541_12500, partial [Tepidisphaeraceae bacterium]|nr:hypothetical protein [Tepidisphaeraceae bacterium]
IKAAVEQLELSDQVRLLEYLTPKVAGAVLAGSQAPAESDAATAAWQRYRTVGERLAATSTSGAASITETVNQMRR